MDIEIVKGTIEGNMLDTLATTWVNRKRFDEYMEMCRTIEELWMSDEDYKKARSSMVASNFANMLSDLQKKWSEAEMLEDMVIYHTGKTKQELLIIYLTHIGKGEAYINLTDEKYMKFLSDYIDCNFDIDALVAINEL